MLSIRDTARSAMGRREWLRIGGLNTLGLSLPGFLAAQEQDTVGNTADPTFGRAKNVIYLYLGGGPPQHETFDPKPDAPAAVRGGFGPIHTNICLLYTSDAADE